MSFQTAFLHDPARPLPGNASDPSTPPPLPSTPAARRRLGEILLEAGAISASDLGHAIMMQRRLAARLGDVLVRQGLVTADALADALAAQCGLRRVGPAPTGDGVTDVLARRMPLVTVLRHRAMPWRRIGDVTLIATSRPEALDDLAAITAAEFGTCLFAVVTEADLDARIQELHGAALARGAECLVPTSLSCRMWSGGVGMTVTALLLAVALGTAILWPAGALRVLTAAGLLVMSANLTLRVAALIAMRRAVRPFASVRPWGQSGRKLPSISILVPLSREPDIAAPLTERLSRLDYPRELLDIVLVVEEDDRATLDALDRATLPLWMRVLEVPDGHPRTKPRALNYALNYTRGDIIGIYDAEDAPAPDQLMTVAIRFQSVSKDVACLQGLLDYYNPTTNWMSRCFTIEYATWFRLMLPGLARMGLAVPLGGTTLFFRRDALDAVGGWDAHNVTEDADLGIRLARRGYRTEIVHTTTLEEANAHPLTWVRQRSRWMKGYILTWAVHSRRPVELLRDLGPRRFVGFHLLFMGSILNAILMPFMWSTAVLLFGVHHPIVDWLPGAGTTALALFMVSATLTSMGISWAGCATEHHRHLRRWVPTMELYFPLATLAAAKALFEILFRPFHWDKTVHGGFGGTGDADIFLLEPSLRQVDVLGNGNRPTLRG